MKNIKSNTELVKRLKKGDMAAFDALYNLYCHKLHTFVLRYLKQEEDTEGIVQEVFNKIWEARAKIDVNASFDSFLFTIAYNSTMSLLRKRVSETQSRLRLKALQHVDEADHIINEIVYRELSQQVETLLKQLTPRQREIFILSRHEGLNHKEIAEKLTISENTVKNHLVATLKYLKSHIDSSLIVNALFLCLFL